MADTGNDQRDDDRTDDEREDDEGTLEDDGMGADPNA